ncbi:hypothetical protein K2224_38870 (plasmid) [Streptomyces sp. BHT-5-2]|uniref:hypothetical protein n=1 Tax=unclassified Streptomyces TaxID=2593676 RepID=UPI001C8DD759|nr:hypothetical protein [Streptomyces sp. BHT-5-2]QZL08957.1 hypothetical protein K2224_38870 [Streptomyces sp. BHT-5-2]
MTVFYCSKCATRLTPELRQLPAVPEVFDHDKDRDKKTLLAPSTVPRGHYAIDPEPWGAPFEPAGSEPRRPAGNRALLMRADQRGLVSAGPRNSAIVHPDDVPGLTVVNTDSNHWGCCGPLGTGGRNMTCACGTLIATLVADCLGPHELHLDPIRVYAWSE